MSKHTKKSDTHEEKYLHYPVLSPIASHGTLFARREADGYWYASTAYCSLADQFNRRLGRQIARRRYFQLRNSSAAALHDMGREFDAKRAVELVERFAP